MKVLITILIIIAFFIFVYFALLADPVYSYFRKKREEDKRAKKETEELEQQLRDEAKYDSNYRKRHS